MKKKSLIFVLVLVLIMSLTLTLTACNGEGDDYRFKINGIEGYSDANISPQNKTIDFVVKETAVSELPFGVLKLPKGTTMKVYKDKEKTEEITDNFNLVEGKNLFYIELSYIEGEETLTMLWTMSVTKLTADSKINRLEDINMIKSYMQFEEYKAGTVKAVLENSAEVVVQVTEDMLSGFDTSTIGKKTVKVTYQGKTLEYTINVTAPKVNVTKIEMVDADTDYLIGDVFKTAKIKVTSSNGTTKEISVTPKMLQGFDTSTEGEKIVTINYHGQQTTFTINVKKPVVLEKIELQSIITDYVIGSGFAGGTLIALYSDNSSKTVDITAEMLQGFDTSTVGEKAVTVTYEGKTCVFNISVSQPQDFVTEISIKSFDKEYVVGSAFAKAVINVTYANNTTRELVVTKEMLQGFDTSTVGEKTVTVNYQNKSATFTILVKAQRVVTDFAVTLVNDIYEKEEGFKGGKLDVNYSDGTSQIVEITTDMLQGFDTATVGKKAVTVKYENIQKVVNIEVVDKYIVDIISLDLRYPADATNITMKLNETVNDVAKEIVITSDMVTGFVAGKVGKQIVTVKYKEFVFNLEIKVMESSVDEVKPIAPVEFNESNLYNIAARFYTTVFMGVFPEEANYEETIAERVKYYKSNCGYTVLQDIAKAVANAGISTDAFTQRKINTLFNEFVDMVVNIEKSFSQFGTNPVPPIEILGAVLTADNISSVFAFANSLVTVVTPQEVATFIRNLGSLTISRAEANNENYNEYIESIKQSPYYDAFINQKDRYKATLDYFQILSLNDLTYAIDTLDNTIKKIVVIEPIKIEEFAQFICKIATSGPEVMQMLLEKDNPNAITSDELVQHLNLVGTILDAFIVGFDGRIDVLNQIVDVIAKDAYYSQTVDAINPVKMIMGLLLDGIDNLDGLVFMLQNIQVEDIDVIKEAIVNIKNVPVPESPNPNVELTPEEQEQNQQEAMNQQNIKIGEAAIDISKIIKRNLDQMSNFVKDTLFNIVEIFIKAAFNQTVVLDRNTIVDFINSTALMDKTIATEEEKIIVSNDFNEKIAPIFGFFTGTGQDNLMIEYATMLYVKSGTTIEEFINILDNKLVVNFCTNNLQNTLTFAKDLKFETTPVLDVEGCHVATITYSGLTAQFRYYVYDNTTKDKIVNYYLHTNIYIGSRNNVMVFDIGSELPRETNVNINIRIEALLKGTQVRYFNDYNYRINDIIEGRVDSNIKVIDLDTTKVSKSYGAIVIADEIIGDIYIPFQYVVLDPKNPQLTDTVLTVDAWQDYFVYDYYTAGINNILVENNLEGYKKDFIPELKLVEIYDYGYSDKINYIPIDMSDMNAFKEAEKNKVSGNYTFRYTHTDEKTYQKDIYGVSFAESRVILPENVSFPAPQPDVKYFKNGRYNKIYGTFQGEKFDTTDIHIQYTDTKNNGLNGYTLYVDNTDKFITTIMGYKYNVIMPDIAVVGETTMTVQIIDTLNNNKVVVEKQVPFMVYPQEDKGRLEMLEVWENQHKIYAERDFINFDYNKFFKSIYSVETKTVLDYVVNYNNDFGHGSNMSDAALWLKENYKKTFTIELPTLNNPYMIFRAKNGEVLYELQLEVISDNDADTATSLECELVKEYYEVGTGFAPEDVKFIIVFGGGHHSKNVEFTTGEFNYEGVDFNTEGSQQVQFSYAGGKVKSNKFNLTVLSHKEANYITNIYYYDSELEKYNQTEWDRNEICGWIYDRTYYDVKPTYFINEPMDLHITFRQPMLIELGRGCSYIEVKQGVPFNLEEHAKQIDNFDTSDRFDDRYTTIHFGFDYNLMYLYDVRTTATSIEAFVTDDYFVGDTTFKGGILNINYQGGNPDQIAITQGMLSGFDTNTEGEKIVTVTYEPYHSQEPLTTEFTINVLAADNVTNVEFTGYDKYYILGDSHINTEKGIVTITRQSGKTESIKMTQDFNPKVNTTNLGNSTGTFDFNGKQYTFDIIVVKDARSIEVIQWQNNYKIGETFGRGELLVHNADNTTDCIVITEDMLSNFDTSNPGEYWIEINYLGCTVLERIIVVDKTTTEPQQPVAV